MERLLRIPAFFLLIAVLAACTRTDRDDRAAWEALTLTGEGDVFYPEMVEELPEPARRFLLHAISPGTPLARSVELEMRGQMFLEPDSDPLPIRAEQILAPPHGFVWRARVTEGFMRISGYDRYLDGEGAMLWRLLGVFPVVRAAGADVTRSAAGRLAMEGVLIPSSLVPGSGVVWEEVDADRARYRMAVDGEEVEVTVEVDPRGRPVRVSAMRWSDQVGPGYDLFVVELAGELESGGYRIPSDIEAGWRLGADDEFRFFRATLSAAVFR